jgi:hypothetical protein
MKACTLYSLMLLTAGALGHELHSVVPVLILGWTAYGAYRLGKEETV